MNTSYYYSLLILLVFPACTISDWGKNTFNQGKRLDKNVSIPRSYIRTLKIYDQFETRGIFDALWLSDEVKIAYANLRSQKYSKSDRARAKLIDSLLETGDYFIKFYLLSDQNTQGEKLLNDKDADWSILLNINGIEYRPVEMKTVFLEPEYRIFFGKRYNNFQSRYLLKFNANDRFEYPLINQDTKFIELVFRTFGKEERMRWNLEDKKMVDKS